jgi:hypothetical protein
MAETPTFLEIRVLSPHAWVKEEQRRQQEKWGTQDHGPDRYHTIFAEEAGEVAKVLNDAALGLYPTHEDYLRHLEYELIQTAAVAMSWVEAIRRGKGAERKPSCGCEQCPPLEKPSEVK